MSIGIGKRKRMGVAAHPLFLYIVLEMQSYIYTHLQWLATLFISTSHGFEIESGIVIVGEVASPKVDLDSLRLQRNVTVQGSIEIL
jgi:hypothetical protein